MVTIATSIASRVCMKYKRFLYLIFGSSPEPRMRGATLRGRERTGRECGDGMCRDEDGHFGNGMQIDQQRNRIIAP